MKRSISALFAVTLPLLIVVPVFAQEKTDVLPVQAVTLFSSGVSYTLREGEVNGDALVPLTFRTGQINDILKSLVLLDEGGTVQPAVYNAKDPIGRALQSFAVDLTQPTDRFSLLSRLRGVRVHVETAKGTLTGQIVGVEQKVVSTRQDETTPATVQYLTLLGENGLQTVAFDDIKALKILDERLNKEFKDALSLLASGADDKRRQVTLRFSGSGKRRVRVGYVAEAPLWKISYRLIIGGPDTDKPYLQGWALVENTTDDDWNSVRLSLVSGRPVSFIQDLYQPLYLPRPVVPPDVQASPTPQIAEAATEVREEQTIAAVAPAPVMADSAERDAPMAKALRNNPGLAEAEGFAGGIGGGSGGNFNLRSSVAAQASGQKAGELFQYNITTPVTLPRQQAAMIPVVAQDIAGEKISLYNADSDPRFPLNGFRLRNNTPLHLKGGPIPLFDEGTYAGDARMEDIPPGDNRIITYAVDLAVEGERKGGPQSTRELSLTIQRGVLVQSLSQRVETEYVLRNKDTRSRTVLVEHPFDAAYTLLSPEKFAERTPSRYRFEVKLAPGGSETLKIVQERPLSQRVGLVSDDLNALQFWFERRETPQKIKDTLAEVLKRRRTIQELQKQAELGDAEIRSINEDQERIRKNMAALDKTSALYLRYVKQLDEQETRIQAVRVETKRLRNAAAEAERELRGYLDALNVD